jgi:hypothetical protein
MACSFGIEFLAVDMPVNNYYPYFSALAEQEAKLYQSNQLALAGT